MEGQYVGNGRNTTARVGNGNRGPGGEERGGRAKNWKVNLRDRDTRRNVKKNKKRGMDAELY